MGVRVLIIVDGMLSGGAERQIIELLRALQHNAEITTGLCTLSIGGEREREAKEIVNHTFSNHPARNAGFSLLLHMPRTALQVLSEAKNWRPDIVHTFGCFSDHLGVLLAKKLDAKFINGSVCAARPKLYYRDRISQLTFNCADTIVANSHAGLKSFGIAEKGRVIHNGVDHGRFRNVQKAELAGSPVLCMVGNFTDKKDQFTLISCLPALQTSYPDIQLILIGRGKHVHTCRDHAAELGCEEHVQFIENCDNPEPYIRRSDICLLISNIGVHGEGISNAIIEYMALGKPVIASVCGGNGELVVDSVTGILIKNNDKNEIVSSAHELLANPERMVSMGLAGKHRIEVEFSITKMVNAYIDLYCSMVGRVTVKKLKN